MTQSGDPWLINYWICHIPHTTNKQMNQNIDTLTQQDSEVVIHQNSNKKKRSIPRHCRILMMLEAEGQKGPHQRLTSGFQGKYFVCVWSLQLVEAPAAWWSSLVWKDIAFVSIFRRTWFNSPISAAWVAGHTQTPIVAMAILLCDGI